MFYHQLLTDAAEAFLSQADEHVEAKVAIGRTVKVLEPPQMVAVFFHILILFNFLKAQLFPIFI